jgi:prepilin-type N-terminal cleavage/methylation domain-containing protein
MRRQPRPEGCSEAGFSLVELLIVLVLIGLMAVWGIPALLNTLNRARLVGASREIATLLQVARLEAIKKGGINGDLRNRVAVVRYDKSTAHDLRTLEVLIDESPNGTWDPVTPIGGLYTLPTGVNLQAPTEDAEGNSSIVGWDDTTVVADNYDGPTFLSDGSALNAGAFRLADTRGNFLEVRLDFPATGKVVIQKWFGGGDPTTNWFENGEAGNKWIW